jgi:hypothetical protein
MHETQLEDIKIIPPRPGACKVCAAFHKPDSPHDLNSLYYRTTFRRKHGRYPNAEDAARNCRHDGRTE